MYSNLISVMEMNIKTIYSLNCLKLYIIHKNKECYNYLNIIFISLKKACLNLIKILEVLKRNYFLHPKFLGSVSFLLKLLLKKKGEVNVKSSQSSIFETVLPQIVLNISLQTPIKSGHFLYLKIDKTYHKMQERK